MAWFTWDLHQNLGMGTERNCILDQNHSNEFFCAMTHGKWLTLQSGVEQSHLQRQSSMAKSLCPADPKPTTWDMVKTCPIAPLSTRGPWQRTGFQSVFTQSGHTGVSFPRSSYPSSRAAIDDRGWGTFSEELCGSQGAAGVEAVPSRLGLTSDREELWVYKERNSSAVIGKKDLIRLNYFVGKIFL